MTAFALANRPLPCRAEPLLRFGQAEAVPVVPWGPRGSDVSVRGIAAALEQHPTTAAVLLANHGLLAFGADPLTTANLVIAIEEAAEAELAAGRDRRARWISRRARSKRYGRRWRGYGYDNGDG